MSGTSPGTASHLQRERLVRAGWLGIDVLLVGAAAVAAAWLRFDLTFGPTFRWPVVKFALAAALVYAVIGMVFGPSRLMHIRGSFEETADLIRAAILTSVILVLLRFATDWFTAPRSLPFTAPFIALLGMFALRFLIRSWRWGRKPANEHDELVIVFGAGNMGTTLVRRLNRETDVETKHIPVALLDDDRSKRKLSVDGIKVAGTREDIASVAASTRATSLIIAATKMEADDVRDVSDRARQAGLRVLILPPVNEMFRPPAGSDLRELNLEDLLGRKRIELDQDSIRASIEGKRVLVTGAGGSIGSELCRQISKYGPGRLVLLDRDESALHAAQMSMTGRALLDDGTLALCDIRDEHALRAIFENEQPEVVFHAAALKHLTLLEQFPMEAWKSNVLGTYNVLRAAQAVGVKTFVNISTDKAALPSSVLGYSKRLAERLTAHFASLDDSTYVSVRFGNVLGSRGSVITAFTAQIDEGSPVTVTHPDVERFFMLIPEACQLVLQAAAIGNDGEVMVLAMGKPVKILDVAKSLIELSGKRNIDIEFTGLRPGEKLSEQLFTPGEEIQKSAHPLVSHVGVPALTVEELMSAPVTDAESALNWMEDSSGGHRDHDPTKDIDLTAEGPILTPDEEGL